MFVFVFFLFYDGCNVADNEYLPLIILFIASIDSVQKTQSIMVKPSHSPAPFPLEPPAKAGEHQRLSFSDKPPPLQPNTLSSSYQREQREGDTHYFTNQSKPISEKIIERLSIPLVSNCSQCLGLGFYYKKPEYHTQKISGFILCPCVAKVCGDEHCYLPYERYKASEKSIIPCECRPARLAIDRIRLLEKKSQIPYKYAGCFLDDISLEELPIENELKYAIGCAEEFIYNFHKGDENKIRRRGIYLSGGIGCGKTLLSCTLLNEIIRFHKSPVRYAKINRDILSKIRSTYNPNSQVYGDGDKIAKELATVSVLVIDDFEIYHGTEWVQSILYDIIDTRYENNFLTIINSNHYMSFWKDTSGGRIYSRLREMCEEINIEGIPDYRIKLSGEDS